MGKIIIYPYIIEIYNSLHLAMGVGKGVKFYPKILEAHLGDYTPQNAILPLYKGGYLGGGGV
jgi:hypothetical protein